MMLHEILKDINLDDGDVKIKRTIFQDSYVLVTKTSPSLILRFLSNGKYYEMSYVPSIKELLATDWVII